MAAIRALDDVHRVVDGARRDSAPPPSRSSVTGDRTVWIGCGNLPHRARDHSSHPSRGSTLAARDRLASEAALLAGLLDITGGPFNPFIVMYVTYIWLAMVTLSPRWAVLVAGVSMVGFGWLLFDHLQAERTEHHRLNDFPTHLFTMWIAAAALSELVAHYVNRAQSAIAERQRLLDDARDRAARSEHLASLTTLAAGAAHELSTPLATIAVASRELERNAAHLSEPAANGGDTQRRCAVDSDGSGPMPAHSRRHERPSGSRHDHRRAAVSGRHRAAGAKPAHRRTAAASATRHRGRRTRAVRARR